MFSWIFLAAHWRIASATKGLGTVSALGSGITTNQPFPLRQWPALAKESLGMWSRGVALLLQCISWPW